MKEHKPKVRAFSGSDKPVSDHKVEQLETQRFIVEMRPFAWAVSVRTAIWAIVAVIIGIVLSLTLSIGVSVLVDDMFGGGVISKLLEVLAVPASTIISIYVFERLTNRKAENVGKTVREQEKDFFERVSGIIDNHVRKAS